MKTPIISDAEIKKELLIARKEIRQANKGLPHKVKFSQWCLIFHSEGYITLQLRYTNGNDEDGVYNIAM